MQTLSRHPEIQQSSLPAWRHVLLIAGNALRFAQRVSDLQRFFAQRPYARITTLYAAYADERSFQRTVEEAIVAARKAPLLIVYCGHGGPEGWGYTEGSGYNDPGTYGYEQLCALLAARDGVTQIINACCHAMAVAEVAMRHPRLCTGKFSVIAACPADKTTIADLVAQVLSQWSGRRPYIPPPRVRCQISWVGGEAGPEGQTVLEDGTVVETISILDLGRIVERQIRSQSEQRRWGPRFDHLFYAD